MNRNSGLDNDVCIKIRTSMNNILDSNQESAIDIYSTFIKFIKDLMSKVATHTYIPDINFRDNISYKQMIDEYTELWPANMTKESMANDLMEDGSLIPIIAVKEDDDRYTVIDGCHRFMAIEHLRYNDMLNDRSFLMLVIDPDNPLIYGHTMIIPKFVYDSIISHKELPKAFNFKLNGITMSKLTIYTFEDFRCILLYYISAIDAIHSRRVKLKSIYRGLSNTLINKGFHKLDICSYKYQYKDSNGKINHYNELIKPDDISEEVYVQTLYDLYIKNTVNLFRKTTHFYLNPYDDSSSIIDLSNNKSYWDHLDIDIDSLAQDILSNGMYLPIYFETNIDKFIIQDGVHRYLAIKHLADKKEWDPCKCILLMSSRLNVNNIPISISVCRSLYEDYKFMIRGITYDMTESSINGLDICHITTDDVSLLSFLYRLMDREINYLIDTKVFTNNHIDASKLIIKEEIS